MTLSDRISEDMKAAMKNGDKLKLETLRTVRAQFIELGKKADAKEMSPDDELSVVLSAMKKRKEAIDLYQKAGRKELADRENQELEILKSYLPEQISREEVEGTVRRIIRETGALSPKEFGKVMGLAMKELKGKTDGSVVQELVKQNLEKQNDR